jgi:rubredoxin
MMDNPIKDDASDVCPMCGVKTFQVRGALNDPYGMMDEYWCSLCGFLWPTEWNTQERVSSES